MSSIARAWRSNPQIRFLVRTVVIAVATYLVTAFQQGSAIDLTALGVAGATAGLTALIGLLTPVEPFVGPSFAKPDKVETPVPPAKPVPANG